MPQEVIKGFDTIDHKKDGQYVVCSNVGKLKKFECFKLESLKLESLCFSWRVLRAVGKVQCYKLANSIFDFPTTSKPIK